MIRNKILMGFKFAQVKNYNNLYYRKDFKKLITIHYLLNKINFSLKHSE